MESISEALDPIRARISPGLAHVGVVVALFVYSFALFLPWASVHNGLRAIDGGSASGWAEGGYLALLPISWAIYSVVTKSRGIKLSTLLICIMGSFILIALNNIANRAVWSSVTDPRSVSGSTLDVGFWLGTLSLTALSIFVVTWTLHQNSQDYFNISTASNNEQDGTVSEDRDHKDSGLTTTIQRLRTANWFDEES